MRKLGALALLAAAMPVVVWGGCGGRGSIEVAWSVGGTPPEGDALACSGHGIDIVEVVTTYAGTSDVHADERFPCAAGSGRAGGLEPATVDVQVFGIAPDYDALVGPVVVEDVVIEEDAVAEASVDLPPPDSCADGADNDHDGRADAADGDCVEGGVEGGAPAAE